MTTRHELISTINALHELRKEDKALIAQLQARLDCRAGRCVFCDAIVFYGDDQAANHWRECEQHPARLELEALRAQLSRRVTL